MACKFTCFVFSPVPIPISPRRSMQLASAHSILTAVTRINQRQFLPRVSPPVHDESQYATPLETSLFSGQARILVSGRVCFILFQ